MELIKREDAIKATWQEPSYTDPLNVLTEVRDRINALPAIDAVPVVRCGECKWLFNDSNTFFKPCEVIIPEKDWYCAYGERRES